MSFIYYQTFGNISSLLDSKKGERWEVFFKGNNKFSTVYTYDFLSELEKH